MTINYTTLLGLAQPVTGTEANTWGTVVNDEITALVDSAVAGTTTISADADVTLTTTAGAANQSRQAIILWTASGTVTRNITAPAQSKTYMVINATGSTQSIVLRGVGPTTGITIVAGERCVAAWNGSDFVKVSSNFSFAAPVVIEGTTTSAALRITQLGTGNALLVEDSTNPDSTPFVIDASGNVIVGYTATIAGSSSYIPPLQVSTGNTNNSGVGLNAFSAGSGISFLHFNRSKSNTIGTNTLVSDGDTLGAVRFSGADGTNYIQAASVSSAVDGTPGTNDMPGRLVFSTTADGASTPTERMRIDSAGNVGIGVTATTGQTLRVGKNLTGATNSYSILSLPTVQSDVTGIALGVTSQMNTAASAFTLSQLRHFNATQGTIGASSAITSQYGYYADSSITGATNNYGFYGSLASAANTYNLYMAGTADNYFAGNVGVGTASPTSGLQTAGSSSKSAFKTPNIAEVNTVSATAATGTINYDVTTQSVLYYTTNASGNFTVNFRGSSGTSLNTVMATGESISVTFLVTNGATAYYNSAVQVDGSSVTPKWQGGTAPTSGNASSIDSYTYVLIKTASATFTVLASQTKFA